MIVSILHEHHIADFKTADKIFARWSQISSSGPNILNESDFFRVNTKLFSKPSIVELHTFFLEKFVVIRFIKYLNTQHDKPRVMSTRESDVVKVVESQAKLRANERVGWWFKFTCYAIRLETKNACCYIIHVISPASNHWIAIYCCTRNSCGCQGFLEAFPSFLIC